MTENRRLTFKKPPVESAPVGATATHTRIVMHGHHPAHPLVHKPPRDRRRMSPQVAIGMAVGVLALVILAVVAAVYRQKQIEARFEVMSLRNQRDRAYAAYDTIVPQVAKAEEMLERADGRIAVAKDAVAFVTGIPFEAHVAPRAAARPASTAPARAAAPARPQTVREPIDGLSVVGREMIGGRESPEGILTREELDRRRAGSAAGQPVAPAPEEPPADTAEEPEPTPVPAAPAAPAPTELVSIVRSMVQNREQMSERLDRIVDEQTQAEEKRTEAAKARESALAAAAAAAIEGHAMKIEHLAGLAAAAADLIEQDAVKSETLRAAEVAAREARDAEQQRLREADELRVRIADERRRAAELHTHTAEHARRYAFAEALVGLEAALPPFVTNEGRADLTVHIDRFRRLARQKETLVRHLNERPFRWGWGLVAAANKDVLGADEFGVKLSGARVPWAEVSVPQMLKFLDHYGRAEGRRLSERADDGLTTAILLDELGLRDQARARVREAVEESEQLRNEANRLMPGLL